MTKKGAKTGIDEAIAAAGGPPRDAAEQLPLLPGDRGLLPPAARRAASGFTPVSQPKGRKGRPLGSKNRTSTEWRDYLLSRFSSPLVSLASMQGMHVRDLARELGLEAPTFAQLVELLKIQLTAALGLAPYIHSKMPLAIAIDARGYVSLTIESSEAVARMLGATDAADGALHIEGELGQVIAGAMSSPPPSDQGAEHTPTTDPDAPSESEEDQ